jgi:cell division protein FtsQ
MDGGGRLLRALTGRGLRDGFSAAATGARPGRWRQARLRVPAPLLRLVDAVPAGSGSLLACVLVVFSFSYGLVRGGHAEAFLSAYGDPFHALGRAAGFELNEISISGLGDLSEATVLSASGLRAGQALPLIDLETVRDHLLALPMVKDVELRKNYPHGLAIHVTEREGFAVWQTKGELLVISPDGAVIDKFRGEMPKGTPLVVGEGANIRARGLMQLLDSEPVLKTHVQSAVLVGGRRWTLKLDRGIDARLPEDGEAEAIARLATLVREQKLLDRAIVAVDLRMPDRVVMRLTDEALAERTEMLKKLNKVKGSPT